MAFSTLVTNEIKNAAGTEEEFQRISTGDGKAAFSKVGEVPAYPHRLSIAHSESGSGLNQRRRSVLRFDKTVAGQVDSTSSMKCSGYLVLDRPLGQETTDALSKDVLANLMSIVASLGASTTILFDCTGTGASNLLSRGI